MQIKYFKFFKYCKFFLQKILPQEFETIKGEEVQVLNELSIEYDLSEPLYIVKSLGKHQELPPFQATCKILKNNTTCTCIGKPASQKKAVKQNAAAKILEMLSTRYVF